MPKGRTGAPRPRPTAGTRHPMRQQPKRIQSNAPDVPKGQLRRDASKGHAQLDSSWWKPPYNPRFAAGWALLPLRAFLGVTFIFAGLQKLANPNFFNSSSPVSIQAQMIGAAHRSPIHSLISPLTHVAVLVGLVMALGELAVGLGTLFGILSRVAAIGGTLISASLFLAISFHSSPYFTGSDIVFTFAWLPLVVAGDGGVMSIENLMHIRTLKQMGGEPNAVVPVGFSTIRRVCGSFEAGSCAARKDRICAPSGCPFLKDTIEPLPRMNVAELDRRNFSLRVAAAGAGIVGAGLAAAGGRAAGGTGTKGSATSPTLSGATSPAQSPPTTSAPSQSSSGTTPSTSTSTSAPSSQAAPTPKGTAIGPSSDVQVGSAATFTDPQSGDPSIVIQPHAGEFLAFDAVCPHAGCTVQYDPTGKQFVCPCHGSQFNGTTGAVEIGPAQTGLAKISIAKGPNGDLYVS